MIYRFNFYPITENTKVKDLSGQLIALTALYESKIVNWETGKIVQISIKILDKDKIVSERISVINYWIEYYCYFDFEEYLTAVNKQLYQLNYMHKCMLEIANEMNWDTKVLSDAYASCIEDQFIYKFQLFKGKVFSSPIRQFKVTFYATWDNDFFKVYAQVMDKGKVIKNEFNCFCFPPSEGNRFSPIKLEWIDSNKVCIYSTYKGNRNREWFIDFENPITTFEVGKSVTLN
jgi:hypothetical protein